jgi:hypothetical protein
MPRLDGREEKSDGEERTPVGEKHAGLAKLEQTGQKCSG